MEVGAYAAYTAEAVAIKHYFLSPTENIYVGLGVACLRIPGIASFLCNLSLIACFLTLMFHKVVWQHMQGAVGLLIITLLQIYQGIFQ